MRIPAYILKRLIAIVPTLLGITIVTFLLINVAPGSPMDQALDALKFGPGGGERGSAAGGVSATGNQGISNEVIEALKAQYGFDQPLVVRYGIWLRKIAHFDFGKSFVYNRPVMEVISSRFPVSLQFGIASFIFTYLFSVSMGIVMARREHGHFDKVMSLVLIAATAIPGFVFALASIVLFTQGPFLNLFPLGYLTSENYETLSTSARIWDRVHHFLLPLACYVVGGLAGLTFLSRNSLLDESRKDYVRTARGMGVSERLIYFKYILRNALIPISTGIGGFLGVFLSGSLLIESIFQLEGIGLLGYRALLARDYNLIMGLAFLQSLALLLGNLLGDIVYMMIDPRIDLTGAAE